MSCKVPEARFASESAIDEDVESADAEQGGIPLAPGEDVKRRVAETDVADDVRRLQKMIQRHRR